MKIGLPAGFQGAIFSVSNVLIQSSINSFGSIAMAGSTASANVEGFVYNAMNAVYQTALQLYQPELWRGKDEACYQNPAVLSGTGGHGGHCDGRWSRVTRSEAVTDLLL